MALTWPNKDPNELLDYQIDWLPRLVDDTIATSAWTIPAGLTNASETFTNQTTTVWLSGGTIGETYSILNRITTAGGRTMDQTVNLTIASK
jgi:hypothetical protein